MRLQIDESLAAEILSTIDEFSEPINKLSCQIRLVQDEETRRLLLRHVGEVMGQLESQIGYELRRVLRKAV